MNVAQLRSAESYHKYPISRLSKLAKERLQTIRLDDVDVLYSFHITGPCRLWCMKHDNLMCVLWWDRHHEVYPVEKSNT